MIKIEHRISDEIIKKILDTDYVHIIDDFYTDLTWVEQLDFSALEKTPFETMTGATFHLPDEKKKIVHESFSHLFPKFSYMDDTGWIKVLTEKDIANDSKGIHFDYGEIIIIVSLDSPPEGSNPTDYGTIFFQHKKLFFKKCPAVTDKKFHLVSSLFWKDRNDKDCWEPWFTPEYKKNRAIIFDGRLMHTLPKSSFSSSLAGGRTTQTFVFRTEKLPIRLLIKEYEKLSKKALETI